MWREGRLWFSDLVGNRMYALNAQGTAELMIDHSGGVDSPPAGSYQGSNAMVTAKDGSVLIAQHGARRIARIEGDSRVSTSTPIREKLNSPNDAVFAADGALWFTDPPFGLTGMNDDPGKEIPFNGVYRYAGGKVTAMARDLAVSQRSRFLARRQYFVRLQFRARHVDRKYRVGASGSLSNGTIFYHFSADQGAGVPDGLKVDQAGERLGHRAGRNPDHQPRRQGDGG